MDIAFSFSRIFFFRAIATRFIVEDAVGVHHLHSYLTVILTRVTRCLPGDVSSSEQLMRQYGSATLAQN